MNLPSVTGYCSLFTVIRLLLSFFLSTMIYDMSLREGLPLLRLMFSVKVWINMKSYYRFMIFNTVCSSFKGFQCVVQKYVYPKNSEKLAKLIKIAQKFSNTEK